MVVEVGSQQSALVPAEAGRTITTAAIRASMHLADDLGTAFLEIMLSLLFSILIMPPVMLDPPVGENFNPSCPELPYGFGPPRLLLIPRLACLGIAKSAEL